MAPSEFGNHNIAKAVCADGYILFSERLKAIYPAILALGRSLLTGCQTGF